jgi:epoxyqueuosine reductase QueG
MLPQDMMMTDEDSGRPSAAREAASSSLRSAGLELFGFVGEEPLREACAGLSAAARARYGADRARSAVAAALPFGEGPPEPPEWARGMEGPLAALARFARADWYAELSARLRAAAALTRNALAAAGIDAGSPRDWRYLSNSGLPERRLAVAAGLGSLGRHGLVMAGGHGSAVVLGLLLMPIPLEPEPGTRIARDAEHSAAQAALHECCVACEACVAACPTGALGPGTFDRRLCLQHWSSIPGRLPRAVEAAWGDRLYGCDACQEACPLFKPDPAARTGRGLLGPGLPARFVAAASPEGLKELLRGSALGMSWISPEALARNAGLAAGECDIRPRRI